MALKFLTKAKRALLSRILPADEVPKFTATRLEFCEVCRHNSFNFKNYTWKDTVKLTLNNILDWALLKNRENKGVCLHPDCGCNLYLKTKEPLEECPIGNWQSVYVPNKKRK